MRKSYLTILAALMICGCSKKSESGQANSTPEAQAAPAAPETQAAPEAQAEPPADAQTPYKPIAPAPPANRPPAPAVSQAKNLPAPLKGNVDPYLTSLLQEFVREKGHLPGSILELIGSKADSAPRPPAGYAYAIDAATTQVKLVKR